MLKMELARRRIENKLAYYKPYKKQAAFHAAGAKYRERLLLAANQVGKTFAGAMEVAIQASGDIRNGGKAVASMARCGSG